MNIRLSFKYVNEFRDRHRRIRRYFRAPGRPAVRLPDGPLSSPEFLDAYKAAMTELEPRPIGADSTLPGTVKAAVASYLQSNHFGVLAKSTRDMRRRELDRFCEDHGGKPIARLEPQHIARIMSGRKPFAAHNLLKTLRGLMEFAVATGLVKTDPTASLKRPKAKAGSIHDWTEEEIAQYQARWPVGTMARLALGQAQHGGQTIADHHRCLGGVPYCQPLGLGDAAIGSYLGPSNPRSLGMGTKTHAVATNSLAERRGFELSVSSPERVALTAATPVRIR